jgi:hypothetical protein
MLAEITISISDKDFYGTVGILLGLMFGVAYTLVFQVAVKAKRKK